MTTSAPSRHTTGIQWTHVPGYVGATWNPTVGCTRVSPGCDNCYAFQLHDQRHVAWKRGRWPEAPAQYHVPFSTVQMLDERRLTQPLRAKLPHAYFVDSMADLFHEDVTDAFRDRVFAVMALSPRHLFMILTKRPERMRSYLTASGRAVALEEACAWATDEGGPAHGNMAVIQHVIENLIGSNADNPYWPLANVWLGVSAEDQDRADERIPQLLQTPAAVRFVSAEPLLGPVDLSIYLASGYDEPPHDDTLDWVIVGGESWPRARSFHLAWARNLLAQCELAGVAPFVKQLGARPYSRAVGDFPLVNRHGSDMSEWPDDLRVREFPL